MQWSSLLLPHSLRTRLALLQLLIARNPVPCSPLQFSFHWQHNVAMFPLVNRSKILIGVSANDILIKLWDLFFSVTGFQYGREEWSLNYESLYETMLVKSPIWNIAYTPACGVQTVFVLLCVHLLTCWHYTCITCPCGLYILLWVGEGLKRRLLASQ